MNSAIHPLGPCYTEQLQQIVQLIIKAVDPEHVFLLGVTYTRQQSSNIFSDKAASYQLATHYELLVLLPAEDRRNIDEVQDIIENKCKPYTPVTAFIFSVQQFNELLSAGHPFCCSVYEAGLLLYNSGNVELNEPSFPDNTKLQSLARQAFEKWYEGAEEFLAGAELYTMRKQFKMAAFMLHQVAERGYVALIQVMTGYRAGTHNLDKLSKYARPFSSGLTLLFPRNNEKEERLFRQLQKAYIHSRYKDDYVVSEQEIDELLVRAKKLLQIVKQVCEEKLNAMNGNKKAGVELMCIGRAV
jgi:HEPN domain-containing protein